MLRKLKINKRYQYIYQYLLMRLLQIMDRIASYCNHIERNSNVNDEQ